MNQTILDLSYQIALLYENLKNTQEENEKLKNEIEELKKGAAN